METKEANKMLFEMRHLQECPSYKRAIQIPYGHSMSPHVRRTKMFSFHGTMYSAEAGAFHNTSTQAM